MYLKDIIDRLEIEDPTKVVPLGWDDAYSWRGVYAELAVHPATNVTVGEMMTVLKEANGRTFLGYKGGDFTMGDCTEVYLDQYGSSEGDRIGHYLLEFMLGNVPTILPR